MKSLNLKPSDYIVHWNRKQPKNSPINRFFSDNSTELKHWVPFEYLNKYYLATFNHIYEIEIIKDEHREVKAGIFRNQY